ncbi:SHOCT domain-containing protein [Micromonospora sp. CPCC 205371]|nr:SHOCT domain-containing protein [Micromonospora sp. CPCC 205371]
MPGLIRAAARTAVVAGTATAVSNRVARRQAGRWAQQDQHEYQQQQPQQQPQPQQPPPPASATTQGGSMDEKIALLKQLGELKTQGVLTEAEFEEQKTRILAG